jgi:nucleoside-diphosphate kinase
MPMQRSAVLVKPDGLQRGLIGEIISRFERKGLKLIGMKMTFLTDEQLSEWYVEHKEKPFFGELKGFMKTHPIVAMAWEGVEAIPTIRKLVGTTSGRAAEGGSIRGDFAMSQQLNLIHASSSESDAQREIDIVFDRDELFDYKTVHDSVIYAAYEVK